MDADFDKLATDIEGAGVELSAELAGHAASAIAGVRPDLSPSREDLRSVEAVLHLTDAIVPGWTILIHGKAVEPNGHWSCTLRRSSARDNDEYVGRGTGPVLSGAILAATMRVVAFQVRSGQIG